MNNQFALNEVTQAMKQAKKRRMYERYQALYLHLKGKSVKEIAETLNRSAETVKNYIQAYETGGLAALQMKYSPGAPARLSAEQQEK
ncbi:helix-turn-helix domain-containing protein, partial [Paenibacillus larvae]